MIYLIGGAPRVGKSILCQQLAAKLRIGWISTDLLVGVLQVKNEEGIKTEWNATPEAIRDAAEWFFPYLERFVWFWISVGSIGEVRMQVSTVICAPKACSGFRKPARSAS